MPESYHFVTPVNDSSPVGTFSSMPQVNFSGFTVGTVSPAFSIAGWVRLTQLQQRTVVFASLYQFSLIIDEQGFLKATFIANEPNFTWVISTAAITDTNWHFVAVSYAPTGEGAGILSVFLDGAPSQQGVSIASMVQSQYNCILGDNNTDVTTYLEVASWEIWNVALNDLLLEVPKWGVPNTSSPDLSGLVAAFDFASPQMTTSSQTVSFTSTGRGVMRQCLSMQNGSAVPQPHTGFPIGNAGTWSLLTWIKVPKPSSGQFIAYDGGGTGFAGERPFFYIAVDLNAATPVIQVISGFPPENPVVLVSAPYDLTTWTHIAVTCDGQFIKLYANGVLQQTSASLSFGNSFTSSAFGVSLSQAQNSWSGSLQSLSIWNQEITASQLPTLMDWIEPDTPGLQAFFPFIIDTIDTVNGVTLNLMGGSIANDIKITAGGTTVYQQPNANFDVIAKAISDNIIVQREDYWEIARREGITVGSRNFSDILNEDPEWINKVFANISEPLRSTAIERFDKDFQLGKALREKGIKTGTVEAKAENGNTVFYYYTAKQGPVEVYRAETLLSPMEIWIVTIVLDVLFLFFAMFGIITSQGIARASLTRGRIIGRILQPLTELLQKIAPGRAGAITMAGNVIEALNKAGTLFAILWDVVTASWWSILFVIGSLIVSILSAIFLPASFGWRLANVGVALGTLVFDLTQKPQDANIEKKELAGTV